MRRSYDFDNSSPLQMLANENRIWSENKGKKINSQNQKYKDLLSTAALRIPYIGGLVSIAINNINTDIKKHEHADLILKVSSKRIPRPN